MYVRERVRIFVRRTTMHPGTVCKHKHNANTHAAWNKLKLVLIQLQIECNKYLASGDKSQQRLCVSVCACV